MNTTVEKTESEDPWDAGELGRSEEHVIVANPVVCTAVDESLGLQLISIRLQRALIANLKLVATYRGIAYQPMIRDLLNRFVVSEMKDIMHELVAVAEVQKEEAGGADSPVSEFLERERKRA